MNKTTEALKKQPAKSEFYFLCLLVVVSNSMEDWVRNLLTIWFATAAIVSLSIELWNASNAE